MAAGFYFSVILFIVFCFFHSFIYSVEATHPGPLDHSKTVMHTNGTSAPSHGSRTLTVTSAEPSLDSNAGPSSLPGTSNAPQSSGVLKLRGRGVSRQKVQWAEETVDNEYLGRKKSKICCIYHKPKAFDESSGSESESSCDGEHEHAVKRKPNDHSPVEVRREIGADDGSSVKELEPSSPSGKEDSREPNAYERAYKGDFEKGKGRG